VNFFLSYSSGEDPVAEPVKVPTAKHPATALRKADAVRYGVTPNPVT